MYGLKEKMSSKFEKFFIPLRENHMRKRVDESEEFSLRRDFAPYEARGEDTPIARSGSFIILLLVIIPLPAVYFLLKPGFYEPHDLHHIADIYQMVRAFSSGQLPPRLGPDFSFGFGYPLFNFYYVLPFYLGAAFFYLLGSLTLSFELIMITGVLLSVLGMYLFLKETVDRFSSIIGAVVFLYTPYRAVQVYVRGAMGEVICLGLMPFVAWSFVKVIKKNSGGTIAVSAMITSLFLLSHNYLSFISLPLIVLIISPLIFKSKAKNKAILSLLFIGMLSLGISAYWWIPAIYEQGLLQSTTPFPLADHFPFIRQLIIPSWGYGASLWGPGDGLTFQIGVVNILVVLLSLYFLFFKKSFLSKTIRRLLIVSVIAFFILVILMNVRTLPLWRLIPFHNFIQFPWRLLFYTTFLTSIIAALSIGALKDKQRYRLGIVIALAAILLTTSYFKPERIVQKEDNQYLQRFFADRSIGGKVGETSEDYTGYSEDYLLLPKWVEERPEKLPQSKVEVMGGGELISLNEKSAVNWDAEVFASEETLVNFYSYYFPGWTVKLNGEKVIPKIGSPYGQIQVAVEPGINHIGYVWEETPLRKTSDLISLMTLLVVSGFFFYPKLNKFYIRRKK